MSSYTDYVFYWSDQTLKPYFVVSQQTLNNTTTSLSLFGHCYPNYGEPLQQNLLYLLENFASNVPPSSPTIGQLWYNVTTNKLLIFDINQNWAAVDSIPTTQPTNPTSGQLWWDAATSTLMYWDGTQWQAIANQNYIQSLLTNFEQLFNADISALQQQLNGVVTQLQNDYATSQSNLATEITNRVAADSNLQQMITAESSARIANVTTLTTELNTLTGLINTDYGNLYNDIQTEVSNRTSAVANLQQQLASEINTRGSEITALNASAAMLSGANFTGDVLLASNPTVSMQAATKLYIDSALYNYAPSVIPFDSTTGNTTINIGAGTWVIYVTAVYSLNYEWYNWYVQYYGWDGWWWGDWWGGWWWNNNWWWNNWWNGYWGQENLTSLLYINGAIVDTNYHVNFGNQGSTSDVTLTGTITLNGPNAVNIYATINNSTAYPFHIAGLAIRSQ